MPDAPSDTPKTDANAPASPCIRRCCLDHRDVCLGCARTLQEILNWHQMTPAEKQNLLNDLERRKQTPSTPDCRSF